ncbi:MAG: rhodanese-like domain-containing protein [Bacillaceae bacterium]|nr:rhodanese-like domain-containing protein [Bacillaceae bacterium]
MFVDQKWENITPDEVKQMIESGKPVQLIDVREPDEYASGHIPGAKLISLSEIAARASEIDPNQETIMICRSGNRSGMACEFLSQQGFKNLKNMVGGMMAWTGDVE